MSLSGSVKRAADIVWDATALIITAGAGMGVDSGLPDFRGKEGFWSAYPPMRDLGIDLPSMSNPQWFERDPALAWGFFGHRSHLYTKTAPHDGFRMLLQWAKSKPHGYFVFTSNVDGQFQKAGFDPSRIVECHGSINHLQCTRQRSCKQRSGALIWDANVDNQLSSLKVDSKTFRATDPLPHCIFECGHLSRPNILMFGDWAWDSDRTDAQTSRLNDYLTELIDADARVAVIEIGAGLAVPTVRRTSESMARDLHVGKGKGTLIRINPIDSQVSSSIDAISITCNGLDGLQQIQSALGTINTI